MVWSTRRNLPRFTTYADALAQTKRARPWRGSEDIPVGTRRQRYLALRIDAATENVELWIHKTHCVTWHKDGCITVHGHPPVLQMSAPMVAILPIKLVPCWSRRTGGYIMLGNDISAPADRWWSSQIDPVTGLTRYTEMYKSRQAYAYPCRFAPMPGGIWEPAAVSCWRDMVLDRTKTRALSRRYNLPALTSVVTALAALGQKPDPDIYVRGDAHATVLELSRTEQYDKAAAWCVVRIYVWRPSGNSYEAYYSPSRIGDLRKHLYREHCDDLLSAVLKPSLTVREVASLSRRYREMQIQAPMSEMNHELA